MARIWPKLPMIMVDADGTDRSSGLRSQAWLGGDDEVALNHRAALRAAGFRRSRSRGPVIGIACTGSDLNRCDRGLSVLAAAVRQGVLAAGGLPLEFPVMSLSEDLMKPTAMLYRNLLAIEVEETIRSQPLDGIVALGNCDKTIPAYLMALASADIPALIVQSSLAEEAGRRIVSLVREGFRPSALLSASGFAKAMTVLAAVGGSTNAIIHLCAVAGRRGLSLPLASFAEAAARTPVMLDVAPVGTGLTDDMARAGGVPAVLAALDASAAEPGRWPIVPSGVTLQPALMVVHGNLAPDGAAIKAAAASPSLLRHRGPAVVFHSYEEMRARIDDPALDVTPDSVLVLAGCGPAGMAMPEWGNIPIPARLLSQGVTDMVRITDGRMSGTGFGTVVLHVAPESAVGGPLSRLRD